MRKTRETRVNVDWNWGRRGGGVCPLIVHLRITQSRIGAVRGSSARVAAAVAVQCAISVGTGGASSGSGAVVLLRSPRCGTVPPDRTNTVPRQRCAVPRPRSGAIWRPSPGPDQCHFRPCWTFASVIAFVSKGFGQN